MKMHRGACGYSNMHSVCPEQEVTNISDCGGETSTIKFELLI